MNTSGSAAPVVIVCGERLRGDDAVAFELVAALDEAARRSATIVEAGALDVAQLIDLPADARCIVVDAVAGVAPGALLEIELGQLACAQPDDAARRACPSSTHALPIPQTLALARALCGRAIEGTFLGVGIAQCVAGAPLSPAVAGAVRTGARALAALIAREVRLASEPC